MRRAQRALEISRAAASQGRDMRGYQRVADQQRRAGETIASRRRDLPGSRGAHAAVEFEVTNFISHQLPLFWAKQTLRRDSTRLDAESRGPSRRSGGSGGVLLVRPLLGAGAGERLHALLIGREVLGAALVNDFAVVEHIGSIGDGKAYPYVLFDEQDSAKFCSARGLWLLYALRPACRRVVLGGASGTDAQRPD